MDTNSTSLVCFYGFKMEKSMFGHYVRSKSNVRIFNSLSIGSGGQDFIDCSLPTHYFRPIIF